MGRIGRFTRDATSFFRPADKDRIEATEHRCRSLFAGGLMSLPPAARNGLDMPVSLEDPSAGGDDTAPSVEVPPPRLRWMHTLYLVPLLVLWLGVTSWHALKPLPPGTHVESPWTVVAPSDVSFLADITAADAYGRPVLTQTIFDEALRIVSQARELVVLDYHLFGDLQGSESNLRPLATQLGDALLARKSAVPQLTVLLITDPINAYGHASSAELAKLQDHGINVVKANLDPMRDANVMYSALWRLGVRWWAGTTGDGWLPDPTGSGETPVTFGAWARLLNFKADQRRVLIADDGQGRLLGLVGSADPHEASSQHSNAALRVGGAALTPLLESELAIAHLSGWHGSLPQLQQPPAATASSAASGPLRVRVLTEGAIGATLLARVKHAAPSDSIDIATLYLADQELIVALAEAAHRGVKVRLILDPGKDGFGEARTGLPNQPAASALVSQGDGNIHVRWYRTHGEQFHTRLAMIHSPRNEWLLLGSADLTRHALSDHHLEADVAVEMTDSAPLAAQTDTYFDTLWNNRGSPGTEYTADFALYADPAPSHYWLYRFMEGSGWAPF